MARRGWFSVWVLALPAWAQTGADFSSHVHPILVARCVGCHNQRMQQGGLLLERHADVMKVVTAGNSKASVLMQRVTGEKGPRMPLKAAPLTERELRVLRAWIDAGASGPVAGSERVSWRPKMELAAPPLPASAEPHPLDKLVSAYQNKRGVTMGRPVPDRLFARRAWLDTWGLLPTPEELDAFEKDTATNKREALVDRLLAHNANYAAHWISFWNDLLRNDEGVVYHGDRKTITAWLRRALEENLAYDKFVQTLLNPVGKDAPEGFLIGVNWRGDINASQTPVMQAAQNTAQVFLGINLKCNSCHDSFINRWKLKDAYGLASFFSEAPLEIHRCDAPTGEKSVAKFLYPELGGVAAGAPLGEKRAAAARLFTMKENGRFPRTLVNRVWKALMGRGIVEPADDMDAEPWSEEVLDWLAADFVAHGYDLRHLIRQILASKTYALPSVREPGDPYVFRGPLPRRLSAEQFLDAISSVTGEWRTLDPRQSGAARYARDWQLKSSPLGRAMGRAIRDQVITERQNQPTTLEALEVVNGATMAGLIHRGAQRMRGELRTAPGNLFDSGVISSAAPGRARCDIAVGASGKLWLVMVDADSYDPSRVRAGWAEARFDTGAVGLRTEPLVFKGEATPSAAVLGAVPSMLVVDVPKGATRFTATVAVDESVMQSDINPRVRFFVFGDEPDPRRLYPVEGTPVVARPPATQDGAALAARVYRHMLGRAPSDGERRLAGQMAATSAGLEDLVWSLLVSPEFQYIR